MSTELKTVAWRIAFSVAHWNGTETRGHQCRTEKGSEFDEPLVLRSEAEAEIARLETALRNLLSVFKRTEVHVRKKTLDTEKQPQGSVAKLSEIAEAIIAADAALKPGEQDGR